MVDPPEEVVREFEAELEREAAEWTEAAEQEYGGSQPIHESKDASGHEHAADGKFGTTGERVDSLKKTKAEADKLGIDDESSHITTAVAHALHGASHEEAAYIASELGIKVVPKTKAATIDAIHRKVLEIQRAKASIEY
jgi:hypothetical protein